MPNKIFVSYKHSDQNVQNLPNNPLTKSRDYVNEMEKMIGVDDHIYKGERDNESLSDFKDSTIETHLKRKIYDSSVTVVLITAGMKQIFTPEKDQWIPWEVSYSLREVSREGRVSRANALLAVVIPDTYGRYDYFMTYNHECNCTTYSTDKLFSILRNNMFNIKKPTLSTCNGLNIYHGYSSYMHTVKWEDFKVNANAYINIALTINDDKDSYNLCKVVE